MRHQCPGAANIKCCIDFAAAAASASTPARAATPAPAAAAASSSTAQKCLVAGQPGLCGDVSACTAAGGLTYGGLCRGSSSVKCCIKKSTIAAAAATQTPAFSSSQTCKVGTAVGKCQDSTNCVNTGGKTYSGLCAGNSSIRCCIRPTTATAPAVVPAATAARTAAAAASAPSRANPTAEQTCTYGGMMGRCISPSACKQPNKTFVGLWSVVTRMH